MTVDFLLLERLSDTDLALLAAAARAPGQLGPGAEALRREPSRVAALLERPEVFAALFDQPVQDPLLVASPFLAFAVLLGHAPSLLRDVVFVPEPVSGRRRVPVFEVEPLRELVRDPLRRLFLADLLTSYTHVVSGPMWVKSRRGWRHRRFSELDPAQLGELLLGTPVEHRLVLYRRLGDLSLFLAGVFPDHVTARPIPPVAVERLDSALGEGEVATGRQPELLPMGAGGLDLLERLSRRSYAIAWEATAHGFAGPSSVLGYVTEHVRHARMILNLLTDSYLFEQRQRWFPLAG